MQSVRMTDFDQTQPKILKNGVVDVKLGRGQLWFTVVVNSKYLENIRLRICFRNKYI